MVLNGRPLEVIVLLLEKGLDTLYPWWLRFHSEPLLGGTPVVVLTRILLVLVVLALCGCTFTVRIQMETQPLPSLALQKTPVAP